jgi:RNA polymerase sigma-70 factor (ECF subfamily)
MVMDANVFAGHRDELVALAYRMLGDVGRAEDAVQEAWLRAQSAEDVRSPKAYLVTIVTRLCLTELTSARARREESRSDHLPEPVDLEASGMAVERLEQVSMAFMVALQRMTPAERAVLLLHEVFDFDHQAIAELVGSTASASRKLLERARQALATQKRMIEASADEHRRLLDAFLVATRGGDVAALVKLLADDAILVTDGGEAGREVAGQRNLRVPLHGAEQVAEFVARMSTRTAGMLQIETRTLNGRAAVLLSNDGAPFGAILFAVADGKIHRVFFHADLSRLNHV